MIKTADAPAEILTASGVTPSVLTFQMWTANVSAGRMGFKKTITTERIPVGIVNNRRALPRCVDEGCCFAEDPTGTENHTGHNPGKRSGENHPTDGPPSRQS